MSRSNLGALVKEKGQSVVEVAVLIPILLLILLGVLDLGRAFFAYVTVSNAAREGARYASIHPSATEEFVRQRVVLEMGGTLEVGSGGSLISVERSSINITDTITVTVRYSFTTFFLGPVSNFVANFWGGVTIPNPIPLQSHAVIPVSPGVAAADQVAATASAISAATATALTTATLTPTQTPTNTPTPTTPWISLSSNYAFSGETLSIWGCNFPNNKAVTVYWDGVPRWTANSDNTGCFGPNAITLEVYSSGSSHTVYGETASPLRTSNTVTLQIEATPTATYTGTSTSTPTHTGTPTLTYTSTATPTSTPLPIFLDVMREGDTIVSGTAAPNINIEVRDFTTIGRPVIGTGTVTAGGTFNITVSPALVVGHYILLNGSNGSATQGQVQPASLTVTATPSTTGTASPTHTSTSTPTPTPPTPEACTGTGISGTVFEPDGSKARDARVYLYADGQMVNLLTTSGTGAYQFTGDFGGTPLRGNRSYRVAAEKTGFAANWTFVYLPCSQSVANADITLSGSTPTPIASSTPSASPTLSGSCRILAGSYYHALSWDSVAGAVNYYVYRYDFALDTYVWIGTTASTSMDLPVAANSIAKYYVTAVNATYVQSYPSNMVLVVCGYTPTPTLTPTATSTASVTPTPFPDLVPYSIDTDPPSGSIVAGQQVAVTVVLYNQGYASASNLFWVDLYADPAPAPPVLGQLGTDWQAVGSLGARSLRTLVYNITFATAGEHILYVQVDSSGAVAEGSESNNVSNPYPVWVVMAATPTVTATPTETSTPVGTPTSTPVETPTPAATATSTPLPGSISGNTYILANWIPSVQGRVAVSVYDGATLVASTLSDSNGHYQLTGVPPGSFVLIGLAEVDGLTYYDARSVLVSSGMDTSMDLVLFPS